MSATDDNHVELLAGALVDANDQLLAMYELASITADSLDEAEVAGRILERAKQLLGADAVHIDTVPAHAIGDADLVEELSTAATQETAGQSEIARSTATDSAGRSATVSALRRDRHFGTADLKMLDAVAAMLSGAIHTARLHEAAVAQAVLTKDHDTASLLAQSALPRWLPELPQADIYARSEPARLAGGDLYCFDIVDEVLHFAVGDVSGKGLPAAMMMTNVISASNAAFHRHGHEGPGAVLRAVDRWMYQSLSDAGMFVTLLVGSYDPGSAEVALANAGHSPVILQTLDDEAQILLADHPPVGVLPLDTSNGSGDTGAQRYSIGNGDQLVVASDGITEQLGSGGQMFGEQRLLNLLGSGGCLLYTSPSPRDQRGSRMPSSA